MLSASSRSEGSSEITYSLLLSQLRGARSGTKAPLTLVLGAGCSLSSQSDDGITVASTSGIIASLVDEWLCRSASAIMSEAALWENFYRLWIKQGREQRRQDVARRLEGLVPSPGYRSLARIAAQGCIRAIVTTNFDMLLDLSLADVPHSTQVGESHFDPGPEGERQGLELVKVHGDIGRGGLLFEPRQLHQLPDSLSDKVERLSAGPTLVVGYRGQDHGIMTSLCREPDFNAFWSSPRPPTYDEEYHYAAVLDWMESRNSRSNFLFGEGYGVFDELFTRLERDLEVPVADALPARRPEPANNALLAALASSPRLGQVYGDICDIAAAEHRDSLAYLPPPFAAPSPAEARRSLMDCLATGLVPLVLRNEMEALALALAVEISAYVGLRSPAAEEFVRRCRSRHEAGRPSVQIGAAVWTLVAAFCENAGPPLATTELRVHFNGKTQLTLLSEVAEPDRLKSALQLAHALCWLAKGEIAPGLLDNESGAVLASLRDKVRDTSNDSEGVEVRLEPLTPDELSLLQCKLPGLERLSASEARPLLFGSEGLRLEVEDVLEPQAAVSGESGGWTEWVREAAASSTRAFLATPDPYGGFYHESIPTAIDRTIEQFSISGRGGLVIMGESGTGKTSAIRRFVQGCENAGRREALIRTPRLAGLTPSFTGLFFPPLAEAPDKERHQALGALNEALEARGADLYLLLDGINEFDGDPEDVIALYRDLLDFSAFTSAAGYSRIRTVTTVRTHFFLMLCRKSSPPSPQYFFSAAEGEAEAAFARVLPLSVGEIEGIARLCFRPAVAGAFLDMLRTIPRMGKDYAHPVLLAVAGQVIEHPDQVASLRRTATLFQRFADRMLERLGGTEAQFKAIETIHAFFEIQLHQPSSGVITEFALSRGLGRVASELVRQIADAQIFRVSARGTVSFSHDRIAEHFLGHYLLNNLHRPLVVAAAFERTASSPLYFGGLGSLVSRLLSAAIWDDDRQVLPLLHDVLRGHVLGGGRPTSELVIEALSSFAPEDGALQWLDEASPDPDEFRSSLAQGLWRAADRLSLGELTDQFWPYCENLARGGAVHGALCCALAHAALADLTDARSTPAAEKYLAAIGEEDAGALSPIWRDRHRMVGARLALHRGRIVDALAELSDLYRSQLEQGAWTHAAATALELGRAYRDNTQMGEALEVYSKLAEHLDSLDDAAAARLALQVATVEKNIVQTMVRSGGETAAMVPHYENACRNLEIARRRAKTARLPAIEIEAAVETVELCLAARPVDEGWLELAKEACREASDLLSFHPEHRQLVAFRRQLAKIAFLEGRPDEAIEILEQARSLCENMQAHFYAADCDYQLGHMIAQSSELRGDPELRAKGVAALRRAIAFYEANCAPEIEYKRHCLETLASLEAS